MDFLIAIKAESKRSARVTSKNKVTLLLTDAAEAADTTVLHRDATYNNKLQGTCFSCSKLNANPPNSVCGIVDPAPPPTDCFDVSSDPCVCAVCPPPVGPRGCVDGYLPANTAGYGSGYWVGLQANTYYSNIVGGGWVVAVGCDTGSIVGAFPVTGTNFGYGSGSIGGNNVMIYPAGSINAAGILPQNSTSFPLLGLTTDEGDAIIDAGSFLSIASGSTSPGTPNNSSTAQYFCSAENSSVYTGFPKSCLQKYPRENSGCSEYDNFTEWDSSLPYDTDTDNGANPYYISFAGFNNLSTPSSFSGTLSFSSSGGSFCGAFDGEKAPGDAIGGTCGAREFPATATGHYSDCVTCTDEVVNAPCQYVNNTTNGNFDSEHGGYSAAGNSGYFAIGPANPPTVTPNGSGGYVVNNTSFWENQWNWSYGNQEVSIPIGNQQYENFPAIIPPIGSLLNKCQCPNDQTQVQSVIFVESYPCNCTCSNIAPEGVGVITLSTPGYSSCGASCSSKCPNSLCSCNSISSGGLGRPQTYGYAPCRNCDCTDPNNPVDNPNLFTNNNSITTIWWSGNTEGISLGAIDGRNKVDFQIPDQCMNSCKDIFAIANPACVTGCTSILVYDPDTETATITNSLENCTGFDDIQDLLDDPCARSHYLPAYLKDCNLTFNNTPVHTYNNSGYTGFPITGGGPSEPTNQDNFYYNLVNYIEVSNCAECLQRPDNKSSLRDCLCGDLPPSDCYLANIAGPFADTVEQRCGGVSITALYGCSVPTIEEREFESCSGDCSETQLKDRLVFKTIENNCKNSDGSQASDDLVVDPCGCCGQSVNPSGGGNLNGNVDSGIPIVGCSSNGGNNCQADCCQGSGCVNAACPLPNGITGPDPADCI
jgi:hypothetical protein